MCPKRAHLQQISAAMAELRRPPDDYALLVPEPQRPAFVASLADAIAQDLQELADHAWAQGWISPAPQQLRLFG
jgi:hypothetical protein